jgi:hypothetical protein
LHWLLDDGGEVGDTRAATTAEADGGGGGGGTGDAMPWMSSTQAATTSPSGHDVALRRWTTASFTIETVKCYLK